MIESHWKNQRHDKKHDQHALVIRAENQQAEETNQQDGSLRGHDICQYRAYKKPILAFEKRHADRAVVPDPKRLRHYRGLSANWTKQFQTTPQYPLDVWKICFHASCHINPLITKKANKS